jgi:hypothetical protein
MCDRDSAEIVAREWGTRLSKGEEGTCSVGGNSWRATIGGNRRVRAALLPWIAKGWLRGEKLDQYFEAEAKCRRAKRVFQKPPENKQGRTAKLSVKTIQSP